MGQADTESRESSRETDANWRLGPRVQITKELKVDIVTVSTAIDTTLNVLSVVGGSAIVAAVLPKPSENAYKVFILVRKIVDFVGANFFNAKNG